jgi:quinol-cytochrome oxidoreductase complex cytochrome b subunit
MAEYASGKDPRVCPGVRKQVTGLRTVVRAAFEGVDNVFNSAFTPALNPLYHLGTLGWFFYWITIVSGIYLYIFFDTGINQAYESLEYITNVQWYAGGVMRSLHRYASDALIIVMMLHLTREFVMDRYRGARWFTWFTGVPLLWLVFACGISGYWMVWDVLAQYIAIASTEWLDSLGIFGQSIARNFLNNDTLSGRFFTLMVFIHIAVPLFMLLVMWIHIQRQRNARVNPPVGLALGTLGMLLALSLARPAVSQAPANLDRVPSVIDLDWFYLVA